MIFYLNALFKKYVHLNRLWYIMAELAINEVDARHGTIGLDLHLNYKVTISTGQNVTVIFLRRFVVGLGLLLAHQCVKHKH